MAACTLGVRGISAHSYSPVSRWRARLGALRIISLSACLLLSAGAGDAGEPTQRPPLAGILSELREMVSGDRWDHAHKYMVSTVGRHPSSVPGFEWNYFSSFLQDAANYPDERPGQKRGRAKVADMLGLYEKALVHYGEWAARARRGQERYNARSSAAFCAWRAATQAVRQGEYEQAALMLDKMRDTDASWLGQAGKKKGELVRMLMANRTDIVCRIDFAREFWGSNVPALGEHHLEARQFLVDSLNMAPNADQRLRLYQLIQQYSLAIDDADTAAKYTDRIYLRYSTTPDACARSVFALAQYYLQHGQMQEARQNLERMLRLPGGNMAGEAHLALSEVFGKLKNEAGMVHHLRIVASMPPEETRRSIMDTSDTQQIAIVRLGRHFRSKGDSAQALEWFRSWQPRSWCGNGQVQFAWERNLYIARCLVDLGRDKQAVRDHLLPHLLADEEAMLYWDVEIPKLTVALYEKEGDLGALVKLIRPHAAVEHNHPAQIALALAETRIELRDGETKALIDRLCNAGRSGTGIRGRSRNLEASAAAQALSEMGGREFSALRWRYDTLWDSGNERVDYKTGLWVLYAIALSESPEAGPFLEELLQAAKDDPSGATTGVRADDIRLAVSLAEQTRAEQKERSAK